MPSCSCGINMLEAFEKNSIIQGKVNIKISLSFGLCVYLCIYLCFTFSSIATKEWAGTEALASAMEYLDAYPSSKSLPWEGLKFIGSTLFTSPLNTVYCMTDWAHLLLSKVNIYWGPLGTAGGEECSHYL